MSTIYPEERRLATVMFADIQDFTPLADQLDFEEISDLVKEIWLRVDTIIEAYGGYIDKHIGDAVMAVWGVLHAQEDDAERAVSAALALQTSLNEYAKQSPRPGASELKMRAGINTGLVLSGYVGLRGEYTVMGDTVNVTSRMEQAADPGCVVISESTYRLVRGLFRLRRLPSLSLKGKTAPLQAFLVEGSLDQPNGLRYRGGGGLQTHMVSREAELTRLETLYRQVCNTKSPLLALVTGEPGIGKSRLLMEFSSQLDVDEPSLTLIPARGLAQAAKVPFFLWKLLWHNRFMVSDNDPPDSARDKFLHGVQKIWGQRLGPASALEAAHLIGNLTGMEWPGSPYLASFKDDPEALVKRAYELNRELIRRACFTGPTILLLDDLQWGDNGSLEMILYLLQPAPDPMPLLILAGARPELLRRQPSWAEVAQVITLGILPTNAETVAAAYPDLKFLPEELRVELVQRADGNPYFLEEMVKTLMQMGLIGSNATNQEIASGIRERLPESLQAVLQSRLDSLSPETRAVAELASVVGRVFWVGAVVAAAHQRIGTTPLTALSTNPEPVIQEALRQLVQAEMAFPRTGSVFAGEQEYIFKHSLLREVAYRLLPHKYRRQVHLTVANWLNQRVGQDFKVIVADHLEQAGAYLRAAQEFDLAARYSISRGANEEAAWLQAHARELRTKPPVASGPLSGSGILPKLAGK